MSLSLQHSWGVSLGVHLMLVFVLLGGQPSVLDNPPLLPPQATLQTARTLPQEPLHVAAISNAEVQALVQRWETEEQEQSQNALKKTQALEQKNKALEHKVAEERARADAAQKEQQRLAQQQHKGLAQLKNEVEQLKKNLVQAEQDVAQERARTAEEVTKQEAAVLAAQKDLQEARKALSAEQALREMMRQEAQAKATEEAIERTLARIQERVSHVWTRPVGVPDALVCEIEVQLNRQGGVHAAHVVRGSGHASFDRSAVAAVYEASPLPLPETSEAQALLQQFTFVFEPGGA